MEENRLIKTAEEAIRSCLEEIPFLTIQEVLSGFKQPKVQADLWIKLESPSGSTNLVVEVKKQGEPRFIRNAVNQLLQYLEYLPDAVGIIIAPYISSRSAEICREAGVGFIDFAGNCFLMFQQIYIKKEGKPNPKIEKRVLRSLYYPKAERVLRVLLNHPDRLWKLQTLAEEARVSLGLCSKVKQRLDAVEWIVNSPRGFRLIGWRELLEEWIKHYHYTKSRVFEFYSLKSQNYVEEQLSTYCSDKEIKYALTLFSGASRVAPYTHYNRVYAYVERDIDNIKEVLGLKPVSSGSNVAILMPYDEGVFYKQRAYDGINVVSPIQLYLDLINHKGRGGEAAKYLFEKVIKPQWSQKQIMDNEK